MGKYTPLILSGVYGGTGPPVFIAVHANLLGDIVLYIIIIIKQTNSAINSFCWDGGQHLPTYRENSRVDKSGQFCYQVKYHCIHHNMKTYEWNRHLCKIFFAYNLTLCTNVCVYKDARVSPTTCMCNVWCLTFCFQHRTFSKFNVNCIGEPIHTLPRPRQNSVFVGSSATMVTLPMNPPRKTKSAMDIQTLVLAECGTGCSGSISPMTTFHPAESRRPSCSRLETIHVTNVWNKRRLWTLQVHIYHLCTRNQDFVMSSMCKTKAGSELKPYVSPVYQVPRFC
jgi:hypothetical protein